MTQRVRIIQRRDVFIVQKKMKFLWWYYWTNGFINLFMDGDGYEFKNLEDAKKGQQELLEYLDTPKKRIISE